VEIIYGVYIHNFPVNQLVKEFWKSVHICQSYCQIPRGIWHSFFGTQCSAINKLQRGVLSILQQWQSLDNTCGMAESWTKSRSNTWSFAIMSSAWLQPTGQLFIVVAVFLLRVLCIHITINEIFSLTNHFVFHLCESLDE